MTERATGIATGLAQVAKWLVLAPPQVDTPFHGVSTDTRTLLSGNLFIALRGERFDAHEHLEEALAKGAAAALVERPVAVALPQLVVADTRLALGLLAAAWRRELGLPLVAVTGSNGKTTVKEMCAAILRRMGPTLATRGNLNNDIGVPLTLLQLKRGHAYGVIEMGANHPREIAYLSGLTRPDVAVVTNAGPAHLAGFGSLEGVARAKGEIYSGLSADGVAVINADDIHAGLWRELAAGRQVLSFGLDAPAEVNATWNFTEQGTHVRCLVEGERFEFELPLLGRHNVMNALAAVAVTHLLGASAQTIASGLAAMAPVPGRLRLLAAAHGARLIDDTYNANPASLQVGMEVLAAYAGRRLLALGDMGELGETAPQLHREAGEAARRLGLDGLYATGELACEAAAAFGEHGHCFGDHEALVEALRPELAADVTVLVKGSRASRMERIVEALGAGGEA